jgi:hypothetical protein
MVFGCIDGEQQEESTMDTDGFRDMESFNKWSDANDGLCFSPGCDEAQLYSSSSSTASSDDEDVGALTTPISELTPATVMGTMDTPSSILIVSDDSVDEEDGSVHTHESESSSFQDYSLGSTSSTTQYSPVYEDESVCTPTNYYIVTPLPREPSPLPKESEQQEQEIEQQPNKAKKKRQKAKPAIKRIKARVNDDGDVELVYRNKAHLKNSGLLQSVKPLQRMRTLTRMATFFKPPVQLQGSGEGTKSLSDEERKKEDDKKEESKNETSKKEEKDEVTKIEEQNDEDVNAVLNAQLKTEHYSSTQRVTSGNPTSVYPKPKRLVKLLETAICSEAVAQRNVLDLYGDDSLEGSTEVLYKSGSTFVRVTPEEVCKMNLKRMGPVKRYPRGWNWIRKRQKRLPRS